jgi:plastocyanin
VLCCGLVLSGCSGSSSSSGDRSSSNGSSGNAPASVSFGASSTLVASGDSVTLTWSASNANNCTASGGWSGTKSLSGSETVGPITQDTGFTLSCSGDGGGSVRQVSVSVDQGNGASVSLSADPEYVESGGSSTLSWDASDASSCTASGGWSGGQPTSGSFTVGPINANTTYQLSCSGPSGTAMGMVTVQVVDKVLRWQAPSQNVDGTPLTDLAGYVIYWGTNSRNYTGSHTINSPTITEWEATMAPGNYYFAMTAFDAENNESGYSNEVLKIIP